MEWLEAIALSLTRFDRIDLEIEKGKLLKVNV